MKTFKIVAKQKGGSDLQTFSVDAANQSQASRFIYATLPGYRITSLKEIGWQLDCHYDFVTVSHVTHIAGVKAARRRRLARQA
jgi:hypothetical protein